MPYPVVSPPDRVIADLCLAADGLLADHLAGDPLDSAHRPGHRARLVLDARVAREAIAEGGLVIADAESVPVVEVRDLAEWSASDDGTSVEVTGIATPASNTATGVGQQLRVSRSPLPAASGPRTVVVLGRPLLTADLARFTAGEVVLAVPIAGPSPDGLPAAALVRLTARAAAVLRGRGLDVHVVAVTLAWRDPGSDDLLAEVIATALGGSLWQPLPAVRGDGAWAELLAALDGEGAEPRGDEVDDAVLAELLRWRPPRHRRGLVVFFTGLSGAGKSTVARALADHLTETGERTVTLLDGDEVRRLLSAGLGFGADGRHQNVTRIGYVAAEVARHGGVAICAPIAPYERSREAAREFVTHAGGDFVLVHVATTLADCEARDVKGLYARARAGEIAEFTGISDPYEMPMAAEVRIETAGRRVEESLGDVLAYLGSGGWLGGPRGG